MIKYRALKILLTLVFFVGWAGGQLIFFQYFFADVVNELYEYEIRKSPPNVVETLSLVNKAIILNSNEPSYYLDRARIYVVLGEDYYLEAIQDIEYATNLNHMNLATLRNSVPILTIIAQGGSHLEFIDRYFRKLSTSYPKDAGVQVLIAKSYKKIGNNSAYGEMVQKIKEIRPDLIDWALD